MASRRSSAEGAERKALLVGTALDVIAEHGVHKTTHRRIADRANVPLGSATYYFSGLGEILEAAFSSYTSEMAENYRQALATAQDPEETAEALVAFIGGSSRSASDRRILFELYSYAQYEPRAKQIVKTWIATTQEALRPHCSEETAAAVDTFIEGATVRAALGEQTLDEAGLRRGLLALLRRS